MSFNQVCLQINQSQVLGDQLRLCHAADFSVPRNATMKPKLSGSDLTNWTLGLRCENTPRDILSVSVLFDT